MNPLRIIFMGTPDFAVGILDSIVKAGYDVAAVVTATDKPAGRGQQLQFSAVKQYALSHTIPVLQPANLKSEDFLAELASYNANLQVVVAFRMLPKAVWAMPELGTFNLHASLLPEYRGAAPINWAIMNGETKTGVTTFFIDDKIDTGAMILKKEADIGPDEDAGSLHDRLMALGREAVVETLSLIEKGEAATTVQPEAENAKTAYKLHKDNTRIDWSRSGTDIHNHIRGLSPYPSAWTLIRDNGQEWNVKIHQATFEPGLQESPAGRILAGKKDLRVAVADGFIRVTALQFPGKKKMTASELLNGIRFSDEATAF